MATKLKKGDKTLVIKSGTTKNRLFENIREKNICENSTI